MRSSLDLRIADAGWRGAARASAAFAAQVRAEVESATEFCLAQRVGESGLCLPDLAVIEGVRNPIPQPCPCGRVGVRA